MSIQNSIDSKDKDDYFNQSNIDNRAQKREDLVKELLPKVNVIVTNFATSTLKQVPNSTFQVLAPVAGPVIGTSADISSDITFNNLLNPSIKKLEEGSGYVQKETKKLC